MAKQTRGTKQSAKTRSVSTAKTKPAKAPVTMTTAADAARNGWATDLVFDVREPKLAVSLRLDADVLRFFRAFGAGYQTRINEVLKAFMQARGGLEAAPRAMPPGGRLPPGGRPKHTSNGNGKRAS